jgi:hypothetical protein
MRGRRPRVAPERPTPGLQFVVRTFAPAGLPRRSPTFSVKARRIAGLLGRSNSPGKRNNLNIRMHSRRMTRLTNAFSKKIENHAHAMALHFLYYNFVRIHKTLKVTPAMAAGVTDRLWEVSDMVNVLEAWEAHQS